MKNMARAGISRDDANMSSAAVCEDGKYVNYDLLKKPIEHGPRFPI